MDRAGYSADDLLGNFPKIEEWLASDSAPTFSQLERLSATLSLPTAYFFSERPPSIETPANSFRTLPAEYLRSLPPTLRKRLISAQGYQIALKEAFGPTNERLDRSILAAIRKSKSPRAAARRVRVLLNISFEQQRGWNNGFDYALARWREIITNAGIYVFLDALKNEAVSGFCLYDSEFPIIVLNNSHAKSRQIFTIFHELAHIGKETSGIDSTDDTAALNSEQSARIERYCDDFAAEFLFPREEAERIASSHEEPEKSLEAIASNAKVSRAVVLRTFYSMGIVDSEKYNRLIALYNQPPANPRDEGGGGNYYNTKRAYLGTQFLERVFSLYNRRLIDEDDAARLLDVAPKNLEGLRPREANT